MLKWSFRACKLWHKALLKDSHELQGILVILEPLVGVGGSSAVALVGDGICLYSHVTDHDSIPSQLPSSWLDFNSQCREVEPGAPGL